MPIQNQIYSFIHPAASANTSAFTYSQIYAASAVTVTINGIAVSMAAGTTLDMSVNTISATNGVYVLGEKISLSTDGQIIGGSYGTT